MNTISLSQIRAFGNIELLAKQLVEGFITGLHKSPYHGFSVEFAEHRLYNNGESTRHIDWKVYAKTGRLYTKRYEEETNLRCQLVIDNSSSMYYPTDNQGKITFSVMAAAALAFLLQKQRDAVGLSIFSEGIDQQTPVKSTSSHTHKLMLLLESLLQKQTAPRKTSVAQVLHQIAEKIHKRSLVVIFSDMFENQAETEALFSALQHLKHNRHEVLLFHVTDHQTELNFNFAERPYEFVDVESGNRLKLQPSQVREAYRQRMIHYYHELKIRCGQAKIDLVEADIQQGFHQVLRSYLIKRAGMQ